MKDKWCLGAAKVADLVRFKIPTWWIVYAGVYLVLMANSLIHDVESVRRLESTGLHYQTKFEVLKERLELGYYAEPLAYFFAGAWALVGLPTVVAAAVYALRKNFKSGKGVLIGFVIILVIQLGCHALISPR